MEAILKSVSHSRKGSNCITYKTPVHFTNIRKHGAIPKTKW
jgi:hypothetical protein